MKKKIIALALCMVILSTLFSPIALAEAATAKYYRLNIFSVPGAESGTPIDFMVINEKTYIQAEQLGAYLGYEFMLSETDCTLFKTESNTAYIFDFGKRNIHAYLVDQLVEYAAPFNTIYLDGVAWLPFSYSCALLGISAHSRADGLVLLKPEVSLSETLAMLNSASGYYSFDMISEIGYADWSYAVTTVTSTIVNFLDSLLDGTFINSLGIHPTAGIYNSVDIRVIADSFVRLTNEELEAYSQLYSQEVALASDMSLLASIKEITDGAKNNSDGLSVLEKIAGEMDTPQTTALTVVVPQDLHPMVMKEATFSFNVPK